MVSKPNLTPIKTHSRVMLNPIKNPGKANNVLGFYTKEGGTVNLDSRGAIRIKKSKK